MAYTTISNSEENSLCGSLCQIHPVGVIYSERSLAEGKSEIQPVGDIFVEGWILREVLCSCPLFLVRMDMQLVPFYLVQIDC